MPCCSMLSEVMLCFMPTNVHKWQTVEPRMQAGLYHCFVLMPRDACRYNMGPPPAFWLPGFFFTPSFTTAVLQDHARRTRVPIDTLAFDFEALPPVPDPPSQPHGGVSFPPAQGVYIYGLFLEGCGWDADAAELKESEPRVLFSPAPMIWIKPMPSAEFRDYAHYNCPVYRTAERKGESR
jgi:dynein heavy chain, axonemal